MNVIQEQVDTLVIGGGQAGLAAGYYLQQQGRDFLILDAAERTGDSWRKRWDSLRLFTPARYNNLPGLPFPGDRHAFSGKDEVADYLEQYARHFNLPVRHGVWVDRLSRESGQYLVETTSGRLQADNVIVALSSFQVPNVPPFSEELDPAVAQFHSSAYCNPAQFQEGSVLIVGAGNSGAEIGLEAARDHQTWIAGPSVGHVPFRIETLPARYLLVPLVVRGIFHQLLSLKTPVGRKMRPKMLRGAGPLVRVKPSDLSDAGIERLPRVKGVQEGMPLLADGRRLEVANVVWCTGFGPDWSWIHLPIFAEDDQALEPQHQRGIVEGMPGLYFVGLLFQYALSSSLLGGVGRDARHVVEHLAAHRPKKTSLLKKTLA